MNHQVDQRPDLIINKTRLNHQVDQRPDLIINKTWLNHQVDQGPDLIINKTWLNHQVDQGPDLIINKTWLNHEVGLTTFVQLVVKREVVELCLHGSATSHYSWNSTSGQELLLIKKKCFDLILLRTEEYMNSRWVKWQYFCQENMYFH